VYNAHYRLKLNTSGRKKERKKIYERNVAAQTHYKETELWHTNNYIL